MLLLRRFFVVATPSREERERERERERESRDEVEHGCDERAMLLAAKRENEIVKSISRARSRRTFPIDRASPPIPLRPASSALSGGAFLPLPLR
jgi:hypothetical protein